MAVNFGYSGSEFELKENKYRHGFWTISSDKKYLKEYTYDEAINLTGHGSYSIGLLITTSLALFSMVVDMFGFSVVVAACACEFQLNFEQTKILVTIPFMGAMAASYAWGYISDTQGRRKSLLIAMWGSFLTSTMGAFSPHWIVLGFFKFISVSFCAQSVTYVMIGESCPENVKGPYMFILTSVLNLGLPYNMVMSYLSIHMDFSYDLGFISFTPWRLLALILALPLGCSAVSLHFFYESPKFLANIGLESQSLDILTKIWRRNHGRQEKYPIKKLIHQEQGNIGGNNISLIKSMWDQIAPLFKMPLLLHTLKLYYLTFVFYGVTNTLLTWFPFLSNTFVAESSSSPAGNNAQGLCNIITSIQNTNSTTDNFSCEPKPNLTAVWTSWIQGIIFIIINISMCKLANRRKAILITILIISSLCIFGIATVTNNIASLVLYSSACLTVLASGIITSYIVDLYPTSNRGMAACLAIMVARGSAVITTYLVGTFMTSHCVNTFFVFGVHIISGIVVACLLPSDKNLKS